MVVIKFHPSRHEKGETKKLAKKMALLPIESTAVFAMPVMEKVSGSQYLQNQIHTKDTFH